MPSTEDAEQAVPGDGYEDDVALVLYRHPESSRPEKHRAAVDTRRHISRTRQKEAAGAAAPQRPRRCPPAPATTAWSAPAGWPGRPPAQPVCLPRRMDPAVADGLSSPGMTCRDLALALARSLAASTSSANWAWRVS